MAMIPPLLFIVAIDVALLPWRDLPVWVGAVSPVVDIIPYLFFGLIWFRLLLGGPYDGTLPWPLFGPRSLAFFAIALLLYLLFSLPAAVVAVPLLVALLEGLRTGAHSLLSPFFLAHILLPICLLAWGYLLGRFSLLLPAAAIDDALSWRSAWRASSGNGLRLIGAYLLAILPIILLLAVVAIFALAHNHWGGSGARSGRGREFVFLQSAAIELAISVLRLSMVALLATIAAEAYRRLPGGMAAQNQVRLRSE
jgi:hypothetical protein